MSDCPRVEAGSGARNGLDAALSAWVGSGKIDRLARWLARELDEEGTPRRLAIRDWWTSLRAIAGARAARRGWPGSIDEAMLGLLRAVLRTSRPDGTPAAPGTKAESEPDRASERDLLVALAREFPDSGAARVIGWWFPVRSVEAVAPPLPAWSAPRHVASVLRPDWRKDGDFVVVEHRGRGPTAGLELFAAGRPWLGPQWSLSFEPGPSDSAPSRPRPTRWSTGSKADVAEWTSLSGGVRITCLAILLRGRGLALLADQVDGQGPAAPPVRTSIGLAPGVMARPIPGSRAWALRREGMRTVVQAVPFALPPDAVPADRGGPDLGPDGSSLELGPGEAGRRRWIPWLFAWEGRRRPASLRWRTLTVADRKRVCTAGEAVAARVTWGGEETLVIYRSLGPPARRTFLGFQTTARFVVADFTRDGKVEPIVSLD